MWIDDWLEAAYEERTEAPDDLDNDEWWPEDDGDE
ncbi:hypothetical protein GUMBALL_47 [Mycobacterium phage Gumball]|uniref:Uncharacterized protein n=2 Tax=Plotvirus plot TaxID=2170099 RepID=B5U3S5_9CAUD|nr:gp49 [Mycobacterium phage Gumball]ACI06421.1 hypothetical protein GUMBALL_47 [Mycobacterium phage Gumball]AEK10258.1 hypothetical protein PBI_SIRHARLEY_49 [Mycobacterium phage SirHarley]